MNAESEIKSLSIPGYYRNTSETFLIRIKPKKANGIYIADHEKYEELRTKLGLHRDKRGLTNLEIDMLYVARARTIIPIVEYKGDFKIPLVLIQREIDFDEVEIVSGKYRTEKGEIAFKENGSTPPLPVYE